AWAEARDTRPVAELLPDRRLGGLAILAVVVMTTLVLVPAPTDVALAQRQADRASIEEEAERMEELADELPEETGEQLREMAEKLRQAADLESAIDTLEEASQDLAAQLDPAALSKRTGLAGLETSFDQQPVSEGDSAAEQLRDLADQISDGDLSGLSDAVSQLRQRAADAAGVDPVLSQALERAADELTQLGAGTGDPQSAAQSLQEAAGAIDSAHAEAAAQQARGEVGSALQ